MADVNGGVQAVRFSAKRGPFLGRQRHGPTIAGSTSRRGGTRLSVAAEKLEWIDRLAVPVFAVGGPAHHLEMQVRGVLRCVPGRADEAERVTLRDRLPRHHRLVVSLHMSVV